MGWTSVSGVNPTRHILPLRIHNTDTAKVQCGVCFQPERRITLWTTGQVLQSVVSKNPSHNRHDRRPILSRPGLNCFNSLDNLVDERKEEIGDSCVEAEVKPAANEKSTTPLLRSPPSRIKRADIVKDAADTVAESQSKSPLRSQMQSSFRTSRPRGSDSSKRSYITPSYPKAMFRSRVNVFLKALRQADSTRYGGAALFRTLDSFKSRLNDQDMCILLREAPHWNMSLKYWIWMKQQVDYCPNQYHYNVMIGLLGAAGEWKRVEKLAEEAQQEGLKPDAIMYTLLIRNASWLGYHDAAVEWYHRMRASESPMDAPSYRTAIKALNKAGRVQEALDLFREMPSLGMPPDAHTAALLLVCCRGEGEELERVSEQLVRASISDRGVVSRNHYYALLLVYREAKRADRVRHLFEEMWAERRLHPDVQICRLVIEIMLEAGLKAEAEIVFSDIKRIYGRQISVNIYKAMMGGSDGWQTDERRVELYEEMRGQELEPDLGLFNQMIGVSARGGTTSTVDEWLSLMDSQGCPPTLETYRSAIAGYRPGGRYTAALHLVRRLQESGLKYRDDLKLLCLLLSLMEEGVRNRKCGRWAESAQVMECVKLTSPTGYLLLSGGGFEGRGSGGAREEAMQAKTRRLLQDPVVFESVVNIFWAVGLRERAKVVVRHSVRSGELRRVQGLMSSAEDFRLPPRLPTGVCHVAVREWMFRVKRRFSQERQRWGREVVEQRGMSARVVIRFQDRGATKGFADTLVHELRCVGALFCEQRGDAADVQLYTSRAEMEEWLNTESAAIELRMEDDVKPEFKGWPNNPCTYGQQPLDKGS